MKTLKLFAMAYMACCITCINAQTSNLIVPNSIITKPDGNGNASARQPDGKILVGGSSPGKTSTNLTVVRYNKNGSIDKDFGMNGRAIARFGGNAAANAIVQQPDGKIIAAGTGDGDFAVARFNTDGSIDSSFGKNGKIKRDFEGYQDVFNCVLLQPDNKILAVGYGFEYNYELTKIILMRFNPDGSFDSSFGSAGIIAVHVNENGFDYAWSALLKQDGKILVAGYSYNINSNFDFTLTQFNSNGEVDSTYGTSGHVYTDISGFDLARAMAVQSNGKIVVVGYSDFLESKFVMARYTKDGLPDSSFGNNGKVMIPVGSIDDKIYSVGIQPDDKIVAAGYSFNGSNTDIAIVRYNKNGGRDKEFGINGKVITDVNGDDEVRAVNILPDGKILVAGSSSGKFLLAWYDANGNPLNTGIAAAATNNDNNNAIPSDVALQNLPGNATIYPNPVQSFLNIEYKDKAAGKIIVNIYSSNGKPVISKQMETNKQLDLKPLVAGIYLIKINDKNGKELYSGKVIKQ